MSRINVARLGGWRAVSINFIVASDSLALQSQLHATETGSVALIAQQVSGTGPLRPSPRAVHYAGEERPRRVQGTANSSRRS